MKYWIIFYVKVFFLFFVILNRFEVLVLMNLFFFVLFNSIMVWIEGWLNFKIIRFYMDGINVEIIIFNLIYFISILMDLVIDNLGIKIYIKK